MVIGIARWEWMEFRH